MGLGAWHSRAADSAQTSQATGSSAPELADTHQLSAQCQETKRLNICPGKIGAPIYLLSSCSIRVQETSSDLLVYQSSHSLPVHGDPEKSCHLETCCTWAVPTQA